ncbi:hypothetical protein SARC_01173 [Sphaeroforma arctica JP610]|uniref:Uncharacterized protein n=1 Tax=Sphaeroforma arctica JP610 TaxID=667725 RepID=A0A0L0GCH0_9EUKA|nr:hypothetical protein SARC_01173 [Sphaeroforma arctica JP610]KNC86707.1 hypothetical protein SARC_01173 [Sphaeroforma arctica JP610]|eukprot:XP_014160609.1 hypothetical protein SARC_01173 [Sphaeroforma arctica JP610]
MEDEGASSVPTFNLGNRVTNLGKYSVLTDRDHYYDDEVISCTAKVHFYKGEERVRNLNFVLYARIVYYYPGTGRVKTARKISMLKEPLQVSLVEQGVDLEYAATFAVPIFTPPAFNTRHTVALSSIYVVVIIRVIWTVELVGEVINAFSLDHCDPEVAAQDHTLLVLAYKEIDKRTVYQSDCMHATVEGISTLSKRSFQPSRSSLWSRRQRSTISGVRRPSLSTGDVRETEQSDQSLNGNSHQSSPQHPPQRSNTSSGYEVPILEVRRNRRGRGYTVNDLPPQPASVSGNPRRVTGSPGPGRVRRLRAATTLDCFTLSPGATTMATIPSNSSAFPEARDNGVVGRSRAATASQSDRRVVYEGGSAPNSTVALGSPGSIDFSTTSAASENNTDVARVVSDGDVACAEPESGVQTNAPNLQVVTVRESLRDNQTQNTYDELRQRSIIEERQVQSTAKSTPVTKAQLQFMYKLQDDLALRESDTAMENLELDKILETDFGKYSEVTQDNYIIMRCSIREPGTLSNNKPFGIEVSVLTSSRVLVARAVSAKLIQTTTYNLNNNYTASFASCVVARATKKLSIKTIGRKLKPVQTHTLILDPACPKKPIFTNNFSSEGVRGDVPAPTAEVVDTMETLLVSVEYTVQVKCRVWGGPDIVCDIPIVLESCGIETMPDQSGVQDYSVDDFNAGRGSTSSGCSDPLSISTVNDNAPSGPPSASRRLRDMSTNTGEVTRDPLRVNSPRQVDTSSQLPDYEVINEESTKSFGPLGRRASDLKAVTSQRTRSLSSGGLKLSSLSSLPGRLKRKTSGIASRLSVTSINDADRKLFSRDLEPIPAVPTALCLEAEDTPYTPRAPRRESFFLDGVELPNYMEVLSSQAQ